jgi:hypothetical protein
MQIPDSIFNESAIIQKMDDNFSIQVSAPQIVFHPQEKSATITLSSMADKSKAMESGFFLHKGAMVTKKTE